MYVLAELTDVVCIPPYKFKNNPNEAIVTLLNDKLANRVLPDVGLCISVWQVEKIGDPHLLPGNPGYQVLVNFSALVFRPFVDEVILGKIKSSTAEGLQLTVTFFDDIHVPVEQLPVPSIWDDVRSAWYWEYSDSPEEEAPKHKLYMNVGTLVRFRVVAERFVDKTPKPSSKISQTDDNECDSSNAAPYSIVASLVDSGLGPLSWWSGN